MAIFDDVLIPWERVFLYRDLELNNRLVTLNTMWRQYMQQVAVKEHRQAGVHPRTHQRHSQRH